MQGSRDTHEPYAVRRAARSPRPQRQQNDGTWTCTCDLLLLRARIPRRNKQRTERRGDTEGQRTRRVLLFNNSDGTSERQPQKSDARKAVSTTEIPVVWGDEQPVHCTARRGWCLLTTSKQEDPASERISLERTWDAALPTRHVSGSWPKACLFFL